MGQTSAIADRYGAADSRRPLEHNTGAGPITNCAEQAAPRDSTRCFTDSTRHQLAGDVLAVLATHARLAAGDSDDRFRSTIATTSHNTAGLAVPRRGAADRTTLGSSAVMDAGPFYKYAVEAATRLGAGRAADRLTALGSRRFPKGTETPYWNCSPPRRRPPGRVGTRRARRRPISSAFATID
jgi:hypothetical protein